MPGAARIYIAILFAVLTFSLPAGARAQGRVALVIGNSTYQNIAGVLNARNDATEVAATLRRLGFKVFEGADASKAQMEALLEEFAAGLGKAEAGLVFYAGHALQQDDQNYLIPVDAALQSPAAFDAEAVPLEAVRGVLELATPIKIVILDSSRGNPLSPGAARAAIGGTGLAPAEVDAGMLIAFSAQPGTIALDGEGLHSPFSDALIRYLTAPGEDLSGILAKVRADVIRVTGGRQVPWERSALSQRFYFIPPEFAPPAAQALPAEPAPAAAPAVSEVQPERELWLSVKDSGSVPALRSYIERYPSGKYAELAQVRIAEVENKTVALYKPPSDVSGPSRPDGNVAERLQRELARAKCYIGAVDGSWGEGSRAALARFGKARGKPFNELGPTEANLQSVLAEQALTCPAEAKAVPKRAARADGGNGQDHDYDDDADDDDGGDMQPRRRQRSDGEPSGGWRLCMDIRNLPVKCDDAGVTNRW